MRNLLLTLLLSLLFISCNKQDFMKDNDKSMVYIPSSGFVLRKAWEKESGEYTINLGVYCSGLRSGSNGIYVGFEIDESLIDAYNQDITQRYSGQIEMLPKEYWSIESNEVFIPKGDVDGNIPIIINTDKLKQSGLKYGEIRYAIPVRLTGSSEYKLHGTPEMLTSIIGVTLNKPIFYFRDNRLEQSTLASCLLYSNKPVVQKYYLISEGIETDKEYTVEVVAHPDFLAANQLLLPSDAWKLESNKVKFEKGYTEAPLAVTIYPDKIEFLKTFYLPISISSVSNYSFDENRSTLLLKLEVKNDYEWSYISKMMVTNTTTKRNSSHQVDKKPISIASDIIEMQMATNDTVAGKEADNKYFNLKIIPTDNKQKWNVELIKTRRSPATLELTPDKESYYDWDYETFHLFYRFKDSGGNYIEVEEIMEAQF
jgi:hypothetical protein